MCGTAKARDPAADPNLGSLIGGRYLIVDRIGHGTSGTVYRAEHTTLHRQVALKLLHPELSGDELAIERFRRAATSVAEIDNDHIVTIHDFGRSDGGRLYLAMELLEGETLAALLAREKRLPVARAVDILVQLGEALMEAHAVGYVHRDLRPRNLFLASRRGRANFVKILDFGLAKLVEREGAAASSSLGMTFGDPHYMSPEQARGDPVDRRADIYSMGCMAYEMVVGQLPFTGPRVHDVIVQHLQTSPVAPIDRCADVPIWLSSAIMCALSKDPEDRFVTAYRFVSALRDGSTTGKIMSVEVARRQETTPPPAVTAVLQRVGRGAPDEQRAGADGDGTVPLPLRDPAARTIPGGAAPGRGSAHDGAAPAHPSDRPSDPAGLSGAWYADGDAIERAVEEGASVSQIRRRVGAEATAAGLVSYGDDELVGAGRRRAWWAAAGLAAVVVVAAALWLGGRGHSRPPAGAVEPPPLVSSTGEPTLVPPAVALVGQPTAPVTGSAAALPATAEPSSALSTAGEPSQPLPRRGQARPSPPSRPTSEPRPVPAAADRAQAAFYAKLGQSALRSGDRSKAAGNFDKALALDPANADALAGQGELALVQSRYGIAVSHLQRAVGLRPGDARLHSLLGQAHLRLGRRDRAATSFKRALQLNPDDADARDGYNRAIGVQSDGLE
jgi:eukaryotic-like serine/threonine-protein kinase